MLDGARAVEHRVDERDRAQSLLHGALHVPLLQVRAVRPLDGRRRASVASDGRAGVDGRAQQRPLSARALRHRARGGELAPLAHPGCEGAEEAHADAVEVVALAVEGGAEAAELDAALLEL
eukprot:510493-Prymnesium_polylepis.1